jgi:hypothetical protein
MNFKCVLVVKSSVFIPCCWGRHWMRGLYETETVADVSIFIMWAGGGSALS